MAQTIPGIAERAARLFGAAPAVIEDDRVTSFAALWDLIQQAARALASAGLRPGDRVALWAPNSLNWITACAGAQLAGGVVVPLNTRLKGDEAAFILNRTRARLLILQNGFLGTDYAALLAGQSLPHLTRTLDLAADWPACLAEAPATTRLPPPPAAEDPCDIMFTSGTTGEPKGVVALHGQTIRTFAAWRDATGVREGDRYLIVNPFFHSFGYKAGWLVCLMAGATIIPMQTLDMNRLATLVTRHRVTVLPGPPAIFQTMLASDMRTADFTSLRLAVTGAANVPPALVQAMREQRGIATVLTGYGLTESCGVVTMSSADDPPEAVTSTSGKPIPGVEVRIDAQTGEILVRGYNVMAGYFEDAAATAEAIDAEGWLHTGDIGKFDGNGRLMITDRMKDMYISGGFNCYPAEIERILQRHPDIAQAAVIGVADPRLGEVGHAFVVPAAGRTPGAADVLAWARENMANYKAPRFVDVVASLPLNAAGKVQKFALRPAS